MKRCKMNINTKYATLVQIFPRSCPCPCQFLWHKCCTCPFIRLYQSPEIERSIHKIEIKASSHTGQCIPAGSSVSLPRRVLISMSIITMRSIFRKLCIRLFTLCKISTAICESCGATYRRICELFSALQSTSGPVTDVENSVQIDA